MFVSTACQDVAPPDDISPQQRAISCTSHLACEGGRCDFELGECVALQSDVPELLLEFIPEATDLGFGGFHIFRNLAELAPSQAAPNPHELSQPPRVAGRVSVASDPAEPCLLPVPVPVRITLTPRDSYLGLDLPRYSTISYPDIDRDDFSVVHLFEFAGVPRGTYDVYWEDPGTVDVESEACRAVPQVFRGVEISQTVDLPLTQPPFRSLQVVVPWDEDALLEGWTVDIVHATTEERLSTSATLSAAEAGADAMGALQVSKTLKLSTVWGDDYLEASERELLRLQPPTGANRPTIYFSLRILEAFMTGQATLPSLRPFNDLVTFEAWVWQDQDRQTPVPGRVEFIATELLDARGAGFYALEYSRSVEIDADGQIAVQLPPGEYRARVLPRSVGVAVYEQPVRVWAVDTPDAGQHQAGHVLLVPAGAELTGRVRLPGGLNAHGTMLRLNGLADVASPGGFRPRSVTGLANAEGRFRIEGVDCRGCTEESGANYSLSVIPLPELQLPWAVRSPVAVSGVTQLGTVELGFPQVHFGQLSFRKANGTTGAFPGALIRAYVLLDPSGRVVPASSERCLASNSSDTSDRCASRALQVASVRSGPEGGFRLNLPAHLSELGSE